MGYVHMKVLVFSDGHIGEYLEGYPDPTTGLNTRLLDTLNVWTWVYQLALDRKVDLVIFGGDRFRPKRPPSWMRDLADERLVPFQRDRIPLALLLGNHDMYDKGGRWNSYGGVKVWTTRQEQDPLWVFDKPGALDFCGTCFYFLPYGSTATDLVMTDLNPDGSNLLFFHDNIRGVSNYNGQIAQDGFAPADLDRSEFLLALGGHVHLRQDLNFQNTTGLHIGSPLERIEDGDQGAKGALILDINNGTVEIEFVESPLPKIIRASHSWTGDFDAAMAAMPNAPGNLVQLVVTHTTSVPPNTRRELVKRFRDIGARAVDVRLQAEFAMERKDVTHLIAEGLPLHDEAIEYVRHTTGDAALAELTAQVIRRTA